MVKLPPETQKIYDSLIEQGIGIVAVNMINKGFSLEDTSKATGLTINEINQLCTSK